MWKVLHGVWELVQSVAAAIWAPDNQTKASLTRQINKVQIQLFSISFLLIFGLESGSVVPDPTFHFVADLNPSFQIKAENLEKVLK